MTMHKGWKLRRMATIERSSKYVAVGTADCGHLIVRQGNLAVGQRVFCGQCAASQPVAEEGDAPNEVIDHDARNERRAILGMAPLPQPVAEEGG